MNELKAMAGSLVPANEYNLAAFIKYITSRSANATLQHAGLSHMVSVWHHGLSLRTTHWCDVFPHCDDDYMVMGCEFKHSRQIAKLKLVFAPLVRIIPLE